MAARDIHRWSENRAATPHMVAAGMGLAPFGRVRGEMGPRVGRHLTEGSVDGAARPLPASRTPPGAQMARGAANVCATCLLLVVSMLTGALGLGSRSPRRTHTRSSFLPCARLVVALVSTPAQYVSSYTWSFSCTSASSGAFTLRTWCAQRHAALQHR